MYFNMGFMAVNYLDDVGGAEVPDRAIEAYIDRISDWVTQIQYNPAFY
jgi:hypothetical protein